MIAKFLVHLLREGEGRGEAGGVMGSERVRERRARVHGGA